jgi:hypothetical protein
VRKIEIEEWNPAEQSQWFFPCNYAPRHAYKPGVWSGAETMPRQMHTEGRTCSNDCWMIDASWERCKSLIVANSIRIATRNKLDRTQNWKMWSNTTFRSVRNLEWCI